ncbi:MAG: septal ring lytic transglycosylase RlpA family protein [Bosea sp. (in: a-proteobacteria)]
MTLAALSGLMLANCAQDQVTRTSRSKEIGAFSHPKYGSASQRVVAEGQEVPKGGGRQLVGRSYTIAGKRYTPYQKPVGYTQVGMASWYGEAFHGRKTANGEIYDRHSVTAAHPTMPLPAYARVTNTLNGRSIIVRVNDRGPYHGGRIVDLSQKTADALAFRHLGTARVKVEYMGQASLRGSDDSKLIATLRTDGGPASLPGTSAPVMVASAEPVAPPRATPAAIARSVDLDGDGIPDNQQQSIAVRQPAAAPVAATQPPANALAMVPVEGTRAVSGVPRPPERPFDLATIPNAGIPVSNAVPGANIIRTPQRPAVAGLFYAPVQAPKARFAKADPMSGLTAQSFVKLDRR